MLCGINRSRIRYGHHQDQGPLIIFHSPKPNGLMFIEFLEVNDSMNDISGWWFQTFFIFHTIWDNPSHWLIFFKMVKTTNQYMKPNSLISDLSEISDPVWNFWRGPSPSSSWAAWLQGDGKLSMMVQRWCFFFGKPWTFSRGGVANLENSLFWHENEVSKWFVNSLEISWDVF